LEPAEEPAKPLSEAEACEISLLRNIRYHEDREGHFALLNRLLDFFVLVSGLGAVIALSDLLPEAIRIDGRYIAAATSVIGAIQLVAGLSKMEHIHGDLRRRFLALHADLTESNVADIRRQMRLLYPDEPPTFHAVDAVAYNFAQSALGRPERFLKVVTPTQRLLRNWRRYVDTPFPRRGEVESKAAAD
jgi:hypothetical protein